MTRRSVLPPSDPWRSLAARMSLFAQLGLVPAAVVYALWNPSRWSPAVFAFSLVALQDLRRR